MTRRNAIPLLLVWMVASTTGCMTTRTTLPGTLDLRSDGAEAPIAQGNVPSSAAREGFDSVTGGAGVEGRTDVVLRSRQHYLLGLISVMGDGADDEWRAAVGDQAMRNVQLQEGMTGGDVLVEAGKVLIPCVGCVTGWLQWTWSSGGRGTRIAAAAARDLPVAPPPEENKEPPVDAPPDRGHSETPALERPATTPQAF